MGHVGGSTETDVVVADPSDTVTVYDIAGGQSSFTSSFGIGGELAVGDVDEDGTDEIATSSGTGVDIYGSSGTQSVSLDPGLNGALAIGRRGRDSDGDGLLDIWETSGLDVNGDGVIDLDLPALGADPHRKDVFAEIDYMDCNVPGSDACASQPGHDHRPSIAAVQALTNAFANAPIPIQIHIDVDDAIPHKDICRMDGSCFSGLKASYLGTAADRASPNAANIIEARRRVFHYSVWAHHEAASSNIIGLGELGGNDTMTYLGDPKRGLPAFQTLEAVNYMHELGHNLGLGHGGADTINCKPNYLSVMNYIWSNYGLLPGDVVDYSRAALPTLNESSLNESVGVGGGAFQTEFGPCVSGAPVFSPASGPIDWNQNGKTNDVGVAADVNDLDCAISACKASPGQVLNGYDDWHNLKLDFRNTLGYDDNDFSTVVPESLTLDEVQKACGFRHQAPVITGVQVSPACLWPPNHKFVRFAVGSDIKVSMTPALDPCTGQAPTVKILKVTSNEPANGQGDGNTTPDYVYGPGGACLRSERSGTGNGRVYTVTVAATTSSGTSTRTVQVAVTHDQGPGSCHPGKLDPARIVADANDSRCSFPAGAAGASGTNQAQKPNAPGCALSSPGSGPRGWWLLLAAGGFAVFVGRRRRRRGVRRCT